MAPVAWSPFCAESLLVAFLGVPSAGTVPRNSAHSALQLQQPRQQTLPDHRVVGRGQGGDLGGDAGARAGVRVVGQKSSPPRGHRWVTQGLLRVWYSPELSSVFPHISEKVTYVDGVEKQKEVKVEELLVMPPVGSRSWCA